MPSFRAVLAISGLRAGSAPESVMETAVQALGSIHLVEANQLGIVAGTPQITLRFLVEATSYAAEDQQARDAAACMRHAVEAVAVTGRLQVLRRNRGRWVPVT